MGRHQSSNDGWWKEEGRSSTPCSEEGRADFKVCKDPQIQPQGCRSGKRPSYEERVTHLLSTLSGDCRDGDLAAKYAIITLQNTGCDSTSVKCTFDENNVHLYLYIAAKELLNFRAITLPRKHSVVSSSHGCPFVPRRARHQTAPASASPLSPEKCSSSQLPEHTLMANHRRWLALSHRTRQPGSHDLSCTRYRMVLAGCSNNPRHRRRDRSSNCCCCPRLPLAKISMGPNCGSTS